MVRLPYGGLAQAESAYLERWNLLIFGKIIVKLDVVPGLTLVAVINVEMGCLDPCKVQVSEDSRSLVK
jgi:hypothetical protein